MDKKSFLHPALHSVDMPAMPGETYCSKIKGIFQPLFGYKYTHTLVETILIAHQKIESITTKELWFIIVYLKQLVKG